MYTKILVPMALDHGVSPQTLEIAKALLCRWRRDHRACTSMKRLQGSVSAYLDADVVKAGLRECRRQYWLKSWRMRRM